MIISQLLMLLFGFALLSLSMSRHYSHVSGDRQRITKGASWLFKLVGYGMLMLALMLALNYWGLALGLVYWSGTAMLASLLISAILTYRPYWMSFIPNIFSLFVKL